MAKKEKKGKDLEGVVVHEKRHGSVWIFAALFFIVLIALGFYLVKNYSPAAVEEEVEEEELLTTTSIAVATTIKGEDPVKYSFSGIMADPTAYNSGKEVVLTGYLLEEIAPEKTTRYVKDDYGVKIELVNNRYAFKGTDFYEYFIKGGATSEPYAVKGTLRREYGVLRLTVESFTKA